MTFFLENFLEVLRDFIGKKVPKFFRFWTEIFRTDWIFLAPNYSIEKSFFHLSYPSGKQKQKNMLNQRLERNSIVHFEMCIQKEKKSLAFLFLCHFGT